MNMKRVWGVFILLILNQESAYSLIRLPWLSIFKLICWCIRVPKPIGFECSTSNRESSLFKTAFFDWNSSSSDVDQIQILSKEFEKFSTFNKTSSLTEGSCSATEPKSPNLRENSPREYLIDKEAGINPQKFLSTSIMADEQSIQLRVWEDIPTKPPNWIPIA